MHNISASDVYSQAIEGQAYRYRSVVPNMPTIDEYIDDLRQAHLAGKFTNFGPLSLRLEEKLAASFGSPGEVCVCASSATAALSAALIACAPTGRVLIPAFTFPASLSAVRAAGWVPHVMDVSFETWALDAEALNQALENTQAKAVMLVSPFGLHLDFSKQIAVCEAHRAKVIIDSAAGLGGPRTHRDAHPNVFEIYSMHATKPFCIGEGGVVFTHQNRVDQLRAALNFSLRARERPDLPAWGFNGKLSELHAAVGLAQIERIKRQVIGRQAFVSRYQQALDTGTGTTLIRDPVRAPWQVFPILMPSRTACEQAVALAAGEGLELRRYYRPSLSRWPQTETFGNCVVSEILADRMCALPVRSDPAGDEADEIIEIATRVVRSASITSKQ